MKKILKLSSLFLFVVLFISLPASTLSGLFAPVQNLISSAPQNPFTNALSNIDENTRGNAEAASTTTDVAVTVANNNFGYSFSLSNVVNSQNSNSVVLVGTGSIGVQSFAATTSVDNALEQALAQIYVNNSPTTDYAIYLPATATLSAATTSKIATNTATAAQIIAGNAVMNFASLTGRASSITLASDPKDSLASTAVQDTAAATITVPSSVYFGTDTVLRNITIAGATTMYAQGNQFAERGGAWLTGATTIYGGTDTGNITTDTNLFFATTGTGALTIYGGNQTSGTVSGSTHVTVANTSGDNVTIYGGANTGNVTGDSNVEFQTTAAGTFNIYGGTGTSGAISGNTFVDVMGTNGGSLNVSGTSANGTVAGNVSLGLSNLIGGTTVGEIYGSACTTAPALSTTRKITINVNTPTITYTNPIVATKYALATTSGLLASTVLNINAAAVPEISGGNDTTTDGFNNTNVAKNANTAVLNLGTTSATTSTPLATNFIHNFTTLNIEPMTTLNITPTAKYKGVIYNGGDSVSTSSTYQSTQSNFGTVNFWQGSGIVDTSVGTATTAAPTLQAGQATCAAPIMQVGTINVSPTCFIKTYMWYGYAQYMQSPSSSFFPILASGFTQLTADQTGKNYISQSTLTWIPYVSATNWYGGGQQTGVFWGQSPAFFQPFMMLLPAGSATSASTINPVEINGYDTTTGNAFIPDYESTTIGSTKGNLVYLQTGNIRQFDYNNSNISDGSGQWTVNSALTGVSTSVPTSGTMTAYASYFSNTINSWTTSTTLSATTYKNLAELVYPTSNKFSANTSPGTFTINNSFGGTTTGGNYITHADVETPNFNGTPAYMQWEYPQSSTSPGNTNLSPMTIAQDPPTYNSNTAIQTYSPGASDATGQVPNQSTDWGYPALTVSGQGVWNTIVKSGNYGFFPGNIFDGSANVYNSAILNNTNWNFGAAGGVTAGSFLVYNTKTAWTNPSGGAAGPATSWVNNTPETNDPDFVASGKTPAEVQDDSDDDSSSTAGTGTATLTGQNATIKVGQTGTSATAGLGELGIANASPTAPFTYNGSTYTDPLSALEAVLVLQSVDMYGTNVQPTVQSWTVTQPGAGTSTSSTSQAALFAAMNTNTTAGTVFNITFFSSATNSTIQVTLGIVAGIITASNVTINTNLAAAIASASTSTPDTMVQPNATAPGSATDPITAVIQQLNLIANDTMGNSITTIMQQTPTSTPSSKSVWMSGWKGPSDSSQITSNVTNTMSSELAKAKVGDVYTAYFQAVVGTPDDGLDNSVVVSPSATTSYAVTITIVSATISTPQNITMSMTQAQTLLAKDTTATALSKDLVKSTLSNGVAGANMSSTLGTNSYGSNSISVTNASLLLNGGTSSGGASVTGLSSLIQQPLTQDQVYTVNYTATNGLVTSGTLTITNTGSLNLTVVPNVNFGQYTSANPPSNWGNIPQVGTSTAIQIDDTRNAFISPWQLTVEDAGGDIENAGGSIYLQGNNSLPINTTPTVVYNNSTPIGAAATGGDEKTNISPKFYLSFPSAPTKAISIKSVDQLNWSLQIVPSN